ncbi:MAG: FGGY-family carbohydrate kinase [Treponema sp.]|jgi:xylulokinase|nr:FGGY-family carbohydrate kinase [Treponema sp.]
MLIQTILCVDIGTSSLKAALIDLNGWNLAFAREVYPRRADGVLARDWEDALCLCLRTIRSTIKTSVAIAAVCISGNGPTLVPLTFTDQVLPPLHWSDGRVISLSRIKSFFLPHAAWFQTERVSDYECVRYFFSSQEWLSFRLGANPVSILPSIAYRPYYWDEVQCRSIGFDIEKFPPFVNMGSVIGQVSTEAGYHFKLPVGIPIIAGGPDFIMALIGVGAISEGLVCNRAGSSEGINLCSTVPIQTSELRVLPHVVDGLWNIGGLIPESGSLFDQYRDQTGQNGRDYNELLQELIPDEPCCSSVPDIFSVPDTTHTPFAISLGRSTLETIGFKVRAVLDRFRQHGLLLTEMRVSGGQSKNLRWNQLKANITDCTLLIPEVNDGELTGDAALAALALGEVSSPSEAVERMIHVKQRFVPNPCVRSLYTERYHAWCDVTSAPYP